MLSQDTLCLAMMPGFVNVISRITIAKNWKWKLAEINKSIPIYEEFVGEEEIKRQFSNLSHRDSQDSNGV